MRPVSDSKHFFFQLRKYPPFELIVCNLEVVPFYSSLCANRTVVIELFPIKFSQNVTSKCHSKLSQRITSTSMTKQSLIVRNP